MQKSRFECVRLLGPSIIMLFVLPSLVSNGSAKAQCNVEQSHKLLPDDGTLNSQSGKWVAVSGSVAIISSRSDFNPGLLGSAYLFNTTTGQQLFKLESDDNAIGDSFGSSVGISGTTAIVGASNDNDNGEDSGSAYLFDTTTGKQIIKLLPNDGAAGDRFGQGVAISGTTAIVGARRDDDNGEDAGSAYVFDTTTGMQLFKLVPDDGAAGDLFGRYAAISGSIAVVGAYRDDDNGENSGSAYLFDTTTGQQIAKLLPDDGTAGDSFGEGVAISGTTAIVGAHLDDDNGEDSGSAYLFDANTGQQIAKLLPDDGATGDGFGWHSVAITDSIATVGAAYDDNHGTAYLFDTTTGQQIAKFWSNDNAPFDHFGESVAIDGTTVVCGAHWDDDQGIQELGSAYVFDVVCNAVVNADSFLVTRGDYVSGGLSELAGSDNADLSIRRSNSDIQSRTEFEVKAVSPTASPSSLEMTLEGSVFARSQVNQTIELFDYVAGDWEQVDTRTATRFTDSTVTVAATGDLSRFVEAGTMCIEARIRYQSPGARQRFSSNTDQFIWTVGQ